MGQGKTGFISKIGHTIMESFNSIFPLWFYIPIALLNVMHWKKKKSPVSVGLADIDVGVISPNANLPLCDLKRHVTLTESSCWHDLVHNSNFDTITQSGKTLNIEIRPKSPWRKIRGQSVLVCFCVTVTIIGDYTAKLLPHGLSENFTVSPTIHNEVTLFGLKAVEEKGR